MIREQDLRDAIAECQGERNPDAKTCIKLAAYYTILDNITPKALPAVSYDVPPENTISLQSGSDFSQLVNGRKVEDAMPIIDELVQTVEVIAPAVYQAFLRKLDNRA